MRGEVYPESVRRRDDQLLTQWSALPYGPGSVRVAPYNRR